MIEKYTPIEESDIPTSLVGVDTISIKHALLINGQENDMLRTFDNPENAIHRIYEKASGLLDILSKKYGLDRMNHDNWKKYQECMYEYINTCIQNNQQMYQFCCRRENSWGIRTGKKYQEDLKNANAEKENYQYLFGNSDAYQTTMSNIFGSNVVVFIDPEKALEQSFKDYEDAYACLSEYYHLQKPKSGDLEGIREFANLCYQVYIEDDAALVLDFQYLGRLLYAYRNTYLKADSWCNILIFVQKENRDCSICSLSV